MKKILLFLLFASNAAAQELPDGFDVIHTFRINGNTVKCGIRAVTYCCFELINGDWKDVTGSTAEYGLASGQRVNQGRIDNHNHDTSHDTRS